MPKNPKHRPRMTDKEMLDIINEAMQTYTGDGAVCESAIGALIMGRYFGWQVLRCMHSSTTLNKYGDILGVDLKERLPPRTDESTRCRGIRIADKIGKFWKALASGAFATPEAKTILKPAT